MIVCGHSKVKITDKKWSIIIPEKQSGVSNIFEGQNLFGDIDNESGRLLLSPLRLTSTVNYFRMFLDDFRGGLAQVTKLFSQRDLNILSGGAFGFNNIWVAELMVDFGGSNISPDIIVSEISDMGGFVTSREITELFPTNFHLKDSYKVLEVDGNLSIEGEKGENWRETQVAVIKSWPRIQAMFIDFFAEGSKLIHIKAVIDDSPGSLTKLTEVIGTQVNMNAIDEKHHDEVSGEWNAYGTLEVGTVKELKDKAEALQNVQSFHVTKLT